MHRYIKIKRLKHFVSILKDLQKKLDKKKSKIHFDMGTFIEDIDPEENNGCGTVCCALGYACIDPKFRRAGLKHEYDMPYLDDSHRTFGTEAGAQFFDLYPGQSENLFYSCGYKVKDIKPKHVIEKLEKIIKHEEKNAKKSK